MKTFSLSSPKNARIALQAGLAFVFAYAAYSSWTKPDDWTIYLPAFLTNIATPVVLVKTIAVYEIILAVWLVSGKYLKYAGLLSALTLAGIVVLNPSQFITTFRDIGLLLAAVALILLDD